MVTLVCLREKPHVLRIILGHPLIISSPCVNAMFWTSSFNFFQEEVIIEIFSNSLLLLMGGVTLVYYLGIHPDKHTDLNKQKK